MLRTLKGLLTRPRPAAADQRVDALYAEALQAWQRADYAVAASLAAQAVTLDPTLPALHLLSAGALLERDDWLGCVAAAEAGLALAPPDPLKNELRLRAALARARGDAAAGVAAPPLLDLPSDLPRRDCSVSVIVCSITPAKLARVTACYERLLAALPHEIIAIRDAPSLCEGYNRGARQARGDILVFSHDDLDILSEDFAAQLLRTMEQHDLVGVAGTDMLRGAAWMFAGWPHLHGQIGMPGNAGAITVTAFRQAGRYGEGMQALDGVFLAARRELVETVGFDQTTFDGWHLYDLDFSWRAHQAGYRSATLNELLIVHRSAGHPDAAWRRYAQRFLDKHRGIEGGVDLPPPALTALSVRSAEEWRRMTAWLIRG